MRRFLFQAYNLVVSGSHIQLRAPSGSMIGREKDIASLRDLLQRDEVRIVTLTGPGGVGKTRLALQVALDSSAEFSDGVYFISLASITDPDLFFPTINRAIQAAIK